MFCRLTKYKVTFSYPFNSFTFNYIHTALETFNSHQLDSNFPFSFLFGFVFQFAYLVIFWAS